MILEVDLCRPHSDQQGDTSWNTLLLRGRIIDNDYGAVIGWVAPLLTDTPEGDGRLVRTRVAEPPGEQPGERRCNEPQQDTHTHTHTPIGEVASD